MLIPSAQATMRGLRLTDEGPRLMSGLPAPQPEIGQALIRVELAGICATDLELAAGYKGGYRGILGHEFAGTVIAAPGADEWVGRRVVGEINIGCGRCDLCRRGLAKHCRCRRTLGIHHWNGVFADYCLLPVANLHAVPAGVSNEQAIFAEPLAAALQVLEQVRIAPSSRVIMLGDGKLGMLVAQVLAATQCDLTVIGRHAAKLALLREWTTAHTVLQGSPEHAALPVAAADVVVEVTGSRAGFDEARRLARPGGVLALKSTFAGPPPEFDVTNLVVDEVTIVGSRCGPFAPALRLLEQDAIRVTPLIQGRYPLAEAERAFAHAGRRGVLKVVVEP